VKAELHFPCSAHRIAFFLSYGNVHCIVPNAVSVNTLVLSMTLNVCFLQEWVVLGSIDIDEFAFQHLKTLSDWERNFKAVKARGRDAEKLPK
jgi:hypothetical protein